MKNLILIILLLFSTNFYSQNKDKKSLLDEMNNYFNKGKIEKLEVLTSEILSGKYGSLDDELKFYVLMYSSNIYTRDEYAEKNYQLAYDKTIELINFTKITSYQVPNKEAYLKSMDEFLNEFLNKHPEIKKVSNQSNTQNTLTSVSNSNNIQPPADNKTVTLTVSGTGKSIEEAKLNALRSAIEQAFGTFVSSKTEILNNNLIKDEIVAISSGNVQKFEVLSQVEIANVGFSITLNATVSIDKLTLFAESKGVVVEYKGGMFGLKIKLQKLNEEAEIITIKNLTSTCFDILSNAVDFELNVSEPKVSENDNNIYLVDFTINTKSNNNYVNFVNYFKQTLSKISLSSLEKEEYIKLNKQVYELKVDETTIYLRTLESIKYLCAFFATSPIYNTSFKLFSNINDVRFNFSELGRWNVKDIGLIEVKPVFDVETIQEAIEPCSSWKQISLHKYFKNYIKLGLLKNKSDLLYSIINNSELFNFDCEMNYKSQKIFSSKFINNTINIRKEFAISDIEKINEFKIEKINLLEFLENRNKYMIDEPIEEEYNPK